MGVFFHNPYDLYSFIKQNAPEAAEKLTKVIAVASGKNVQQDIKDACVSVSEKATFEQSQDAVNFIWQMLEQALQSGGI